MRRACKTQCPECPFRHNAIPGWLGNYESPVAVIQSLWHKNPFFCHSRTDYEREDWLEKAQSNGQLCLGALLFVQDAQFPLPEEHDIRNALQAAAGNRYINPEEFDVMLPQAFIEHHEQDRWAWVKEQEANGVVAPLKAMFAKRRKD